MKESKGTHRFSVTLSFAPKRSSDRVTENRCVPFDSFTCIYPALLPQHRTLYAKVDSTPHIYINREMMRNLYLVPSRKK